MAVTEVHLAHIEAEETAVARRYTETWVVRCNAVENGKTILDASGLPQYGDSYSGDSQATVVNRRPVLDAKSPRVWSVTILYDTSSDGSVETGDPITDPPDVVWDWQESTKPLVRDLNNVKVVNTAGERFDPPIVQPEFIGVLRYVRNERTFDIAQAKLYANVVNSDVFWGYSPGLCLMRPWKAEYSRRNNLAFVKITREILFKDTKWDEPIESFGFNESYVDGGTTKLKRIKLPYPNGEDCVNPAPLNAAGAYAGASADAYKIQFKRFNVMPFGPLALT